MNATEIGNELDISHVKDLTETKDIKKHVIIHFDTQNDIPHDFDVVFKLMGILESVTSKYDEFKGFLKKEFLYAIIAPLEGLSILVSLLLLIHLYVFHSITSLSASVGVQRFSILLFLTLLKVKSRMLRFKG